MSERMTSITLPGVFGSGVADYGRLSVQEMIAQVRKYASAQKELAEKMLSASDDDFRVETYIGVHVQHDKEVLQEGCKSLSQHRTSPTPKRWSL